ncbi:MAG: thioredoxin family protein [Candidatus Thorarchaeota archaeon]|jgi:thiol-disulfide isomerase/thioredoxin
MPNHNDVSPDYPSVSDYIEKMSASQKGGFLRRRDAYDLNQDAVEVLNGIKDQYEIIVFFADWCGDSRKAVPVLSLLEQQIGIKVTALGGMMKPPYGSSEFWAVPPSPEEVKTFDIRSSPTIIVFNKSGEEIGRMKTRPKNTATVEEELIWILETSN